MDAHDELDKDDEREEEVDGGEGGVVREVDALALAALEADLAVAGPVQTLAVSGAVVAALRVARRRRRRHHEPEQLPTPSQRRYSVEKWFHRVLGHHRLDVFIYQGLVSGRSSSGLAGLGLGGFP